MADIVVTATAVRGSAQDSALAGVQLTAGKAVYRDAGGVWQLSDSNGVAATQKVDGITLHAAEAGQPCAVLKSGDLTMNAALTAGTFYFLSATPGAICPAADLASGMHVINVGYATTTTNLRLSVVDTGITL